jgi:hypothetical protein
LVFGAPAFSSNVSIACQQFFLLSALFLTNSWEKFAHDPFGAAWFASSRGALGLALCALFSLT